MKREDYTHVRVSKKLHKLLKTEAEQKNVSISEYITDCVERIQVIESFMGSVSDVNMSHDTGKAFLESRKPKKACSAGDLRTDLPANF